MSNVIPLNGKAKEGMEVSLNALSALIVVDGLTIHLESAALPQLQFLKEKGISDTSELMSDLVKIGQAIENAKKRFILGGPKVVLATPAQIPNLKGQA